MIFIDGSIAVFCVKAREMPSENLQDQSKYLCSTHTHIKETYSEKKQPGHKTPYV